MGRFFAISYLPTCLGTFSQTSLGIVSHSSRGCCRAMSRQFSTFWGTTYIFWKFFLLLFFCLFLCLFWFSCFCFCVHLVLARNLLALGGLNLPCNLGNDNVDNLFFCNLDNQSPHNSRNCSHERDLESCFDINRKFLQNCIHNSCQNRDTESCFDITCFECELELGIEM